MQSKASDFTVDENPYNPELRKTMQALLWIVAAVLATTALFLSFRRTEPAAPEPRLNIDDSRAQPSRIRRLARAILVARRRAKAGSASRWQFWFAVGAAAWGLFATSALLVYPPRGDADVWIASVIPTAFVLWWLVSPRQHSQGSGLVGLWLDVKRAELQRRLDMLQVKTPPPD